MKQSIDSSLDSRLLAGALLASVTMLFAGCSGIGGGGVPQACNPQEERAAYARAAQSSPSNLVRVNVRGDTLQPKTLSGLSNEEGEVLFEGDIVLARVKGIQTRGLAIAGRSYRWPGPAIPYTFAADLPAQTRRWAESAMKDIAQQTGFLTFMPRTTQADYLHFAPGTRSNVGSSPVGRQGGGQSIKLGSATGVSVAIHEVCHSLGLWHEQSRSDRDQYICILWDNIEEGMAYNFDQHVRDGVNLGTYDYDSRMHYYRTAFAKDKTQPTIIPKLPGKQIGVGSRLSTGDIAALRAIFPGDQSAPQARSSSVGIE